MLIAQIRDLQIYQQAQYQLEFDKQLYEHLIGPEKLILDEDQLYEQSLEREGKTSEAASSPSSSSADNSPITEQRNFLSSSSSSVSLPYTPGSSPSSSSSAPASPSSQPLCNSSPSSSPTLTSSFSSPTLSTSSPLAIQRSGVTPKLRSSHSFTSSSSSSAPSTDTLRSYWRRSKGQQEDDTVVLNPIFGKRTPQAPRRLASTGCLSNNH